MAQSSEAACRHCLSSLPAGAVAAPQHVSSLPCTTGTSTFLALGAHQTHAGDPVYLLCPDEVCTCSIAVAHNACQIKHKRKLWTGRCLVQSESTGMTSMHDLCHFTSANSASSETSQYSSVMQVSTLARATLMPVSHGSVTCIHKPSEIALNPWM